MQNAAGGAGRGGAFGREPFPAGSERAPRQQALA